MEKNFLLIYCLYSYFCTLLCLLCFLSNDFTVQWIFINKSFLLSYSIDAVSALSCWDFEKNHWWDDIIQNGWRDLGSEGNTSRARGLLNISFLPGQNGRHFADDNLKCAFMNGKFCILIKSPINNKLVLVQVMARCRTCGKPLSEPMLREFTEAHMQYEIKRYHLINMGISISWKRWMAAGGS